ncbi:MAG TPA: hypothetical protein VFG30_24825 [Polyangiales bacterium]|nr:hypothetical protein [Polyangiales bacterium]
MDVNLDATGQPADINTPLDVSQTSPDPKPLPPLSKVLVAGIAALFALTTLGAAFAPYLAVKYPLILVALNPWPRHVILVAPHTSLLGLVLVVPIRGLFACIVTYEIGRHYGPQGIELFERRSPRIANYLRWFERVFSKAGPAFVVFSPGPLTSTLAAVSGISRPTTWFLSWLGFVIWTCINYKVGDWLKPWTQPIMAFISEYLLETTIACAVLVLGYQWIARKRRLTKQLP